MTVILVACGGRVSVETEGTSSPSASSPAPSGAPPPSNCPLHAGPSAPPPILANTNIQTFAVTNHYVVYGDGAGIHRASLHGSGDVVLAADSPRVLDADDDQVVWRSSSPAGTLHLIALAGGASSTLYMPTSSDFLMAGPVLHASTVYFISGWPPHELIAISGGKQRVVGTMEFFTHLTVDDQFAYGHWAGRMDSVALGDGTVHHLADATSCSGASVDEGFLYFTSGATNGTLRRVPKNGGPAKTLIDCLVTPTSVGTDSDHIYVLASGQSSNGTSVGASVVKLSKSSGVASVVAQGFEIPPIGSGEIAPRDLIVGAGHVFVRTTAGIVAIEL